MMKKMIRLFHSPDGATGASNDDGNVTPPEGATPPTAADSGAGELDNAAIKAHPLFQKLTNQLAEANKLEQDRAAAAAKKAEEAELAKLEAAGEIEAFKKMVTEREAAREAKYQADILERDLRVELNNAGFKNGKFVRGSIADYNAETDGSPAEYAAALAADEENAALIAGESITRKPTPPGRPGSGSSKLTNEQILKMRSDPDPEVRIKAHDLIGKIYDETGVLITRQSG